MSNERGAECTPRAGDAACAADVDEHERMTVEHAALTQQVRHRRVSDQALHVTLEPRVSPAREVQHPVVADLLAE